MLPLPSIRERLGDQNGYASRPWYLWFEDLWRQFVEVQDKPDLPTLVVGAEYGAGRYADANQLTHVKIRVTVTLPADSGTEWIEVWLSKDGGTTWGASEGKWVVGTLIELDNLAPQTTTNWKVKAITGASYGQNDPADAVVSAAFTVAGLSLPSTTAVTGFTVSAPRDYIDSANNHDWEQDISWTCGTDAHAWFTALTFFACDVAGNPAPADQGGTEIARNSLERLYLPGQTVKLTINDWGYNPVGSAYHYGYWKLYVAKRPGAWPGDFVQQNIGPASADHVIADFGQPPNSGTVVGGTNAAVVTGVTLAEVGTRTLDAQQQTHATLRVSLTFSVSVVNQPVTVWFSFNNGSSWYWVNWYFLSGASGYVDIDWMVNAGFPAGCTAKAAAIAGAVPYTLSLPTGTATSTGVVLSGLQLPADTAVTGLAVHSPAYDREYAIGQHDWWTTLSGTMGTDPHAWYVCWRFRAEDSAGNAAPSALGGDWTPWNIDEFTFQPGQTFSRIVGTGWGYNPINSIYHYGRIEVAVARREVSGAVSLVTQKWPSTLYYGIFDFAQHPSSTIPLNQADPTTIGQGTVIDPFTGLLASGYTNPSNMVADPSFEMSGSGTMTPATSTSWIATTNVEVKADTGYNGAKYIRCTGAGKGVFQWIAVNPGETYYIEVWARSSNSADANHKGYISARWRQADRVTDASTAANYASVSGYQATWTPIRLVATAPSQAVWLVLAIETDSAEPSGQYWDFDYVSAFKYTAYTANGQAYSGAPTSLTIGGGSGYTGAHAASTSDSSEVGFTLRGFKSVASDGSYVELYSASNYCAVYGAENGGSSYWFHCFADNNSAQLLALHGSNGTAGLSVNATSPGLNIQKGSDYTNVFPSQVVTSQAAYTLPPVILGIYYLWVDSLGRLRIKSGAPSSDTDGTVVGTQS